MPERASWLSDSSARPSLGAWLAYALLILALAVALYPSLAYANVHVAFTRLWPSKEYTRLTIEAAAPLRYSLFTIADPHRIVLDLEGVHYGQAIDALPGKLSAEDPFIKSIRIGRYKPGVLRLVLDLKDEARAEAFTLDPVGTYGHRLVLDIHPLNPVDPLMALVKEIERGQAATQPPAAVEASVAPPARAGPEPAAKSPSAPRDRLLIVAVDAGHGGEDPGAIGPSGTYEKDVTLAIARKLKSLIDAQPNMRAVLTREGDYFVPLHTRVQKARRVQADLFVSVHADAFVKPHARGSSVYALSERGATSAAAQWLAKRENDADLIGGVNLDVRDPYLKQTLLDLTQTATINDSLKLGRAMLSEVGAINALHKSSVEQAGFAVLKAPDIPSILVETAFITNPDEERRLRDERYQGAIAAAMLAGIKRYFAANPPLARSPRIALVDR